VRDPPQPFEVAEVAQGSMNLFGDFDKFQILSCKSYPQTAQCGYDIAVAFALDPQAMQLFALQDPQVSSLPRDHHPPGMQSRLSVHVDAFRSD